MQDGDKQHAHPQTATRDSGLRDARERIHDSAGQRLAAGFPDTTLPSFVKRAVVVQAVVIIVLVWGYASWRIRSDQAEVLDGARHELRAVAAGMYVHMQAVLNDSLGAARAAAHAIDSSGGIDAIAPPQAAELLSRELSSGDYVRALFVAGEGRYIGVARDHQVLALDSWPQWFDPIPQGQRNVYIAPRIVDPIEPSHHAIPIAVRITLTTGETMWAGALLGVEALDQLYESMAIRDGSLSLISARGDLLLRVPGVPGGDRPVNVGQAQVFRQAGDLPREGGLLEAPSPIVTGTWVYAIRNLDGYRLTVAAGRDKRAILQPWRDRTRSLIYILAGVSVLFVALTALLKNFMLRAERANTNLAQLNGELESRVAARTTELQSANRQLALTNQELEAFTASASHDLRSPLGAIAGQAGLLGEELQAVMNDSIHQRIERIQSCVRRSSDMIDGLLSLARISRQELLNERIDLSALAHSIVEDLRQQYPRHKVECRIEPKLAVNADPRLMKSLLYNLLGNAWKYTSRTAHPRVELAHAEARDIAFSVWDNGAGFDMAGAGQIFEPFHRLHCATEFPGIGIGLATVARIVQRYAGKITVESAAGKGTTFRFTLPAAALAGPVTMTASLSGMSASG